MRPRLLPYMYVPTFSTSRRENDSFGFHVVDIHMTCDDATSQIRARLSICIDSAKPVRTAGICQPHEILLSPLSFEERRQAVVLLQMEVTILSKTQVKVACLLPMAQEVIALGSGRDPGRRASDGDNDPNGGSGRQGGAHPSGDPIGKPAGFVSTALGSASIGPALRLAVSFSVSWPTASTYSTRCGS